MLNRITIMGRLTGDPVMRYTQSQTPVASFSLAVERDFGNRDTGDREVDFINCVALRNTADFVTKYFKKGSMAVVSGRLQIRNWKDKDGNSRQSAEVVVDNIYFGESKRRDDDNVRTEQGDSSYAAAAPAQAFETPSTDLGASFQELSDDGDLPF